MHFEAATAFLCRISASELFVRLLDPNAATLFAWIEIYVRGDHCSMLSDTAVAGEHLSPGRRGSLRGCHVIRLLDDYL